MSQQSPANDPGRFVHPLQSVMDAMGSDPALRAERQRIKDYIDKTAVVMLEAEPEREDLHEVRLEQFRREARDELHGRMMGSPLSDRDREWLQVSTELLKVMTTAPTDGPYRTEFAPLVRAIINGAYARLASEDYVDEIAHKRAFEAARAEMKNGEA